jgi:hypothetical protein
VGGEVITLQLIIFDVSDKQLDSLVLIDNLVWDATPATAPSTVRPPG